MLDFLNVEFVVETVLTLEFTLNSFVLLFCRSIVCVWFPGFAQISHFYDLKKYNWTLVQC